MNFHGHVEQLQSAEAKAKRLAAQSRFPGFVFRVTLVTFNEFAGSE